MLCIYIIIYNTCNFIVSIQQIILHRRADVDKEIINLSYSWFIIFFNGLKRILHNSSYANRYNSILFWNNE